VAEPGSDNITMVGRLAAIAMGVVVFVLMLVALEVVVRITGAAETCPNRFSNSDIWVCDPILHFKLAPEIGPNEKTLNSHGFRSEEFGPKQEGVFRILSLGDSCTFGYIAREEGIGYVVQPYPLKLQRFVERRVGQGVVEVLNAGLPGYNSHHGVMLLRSKLRGLEPDLITVRFGWNDHFLSAAGESELYRETEAGLARSLEDLALRSQLYPFLRRVGMELRVLREPVEERRNVLFDRTRSWEPTIPIELYAGNLRRIIELGHEMGADVWLLTSPRNPDPDAQAMKYLSGRNKLPFEDLMRVHDEYNEVVRRVGEETGTLVVDMDAVYRRYAGQPIFLPSDVPHPAQGGHILEAETLYSVMLRRGLLP